MSQKMSRRNFLKLAAVTAGGMFMAAACQPKTGAPGKEVTLEFWTFNDYAVGKALETFNTFISEFQDANPGIKVNITGKPGTDILAGLIAGAGTGDLPDSVQIQLGAGGDLMAANALADLKSYWDATSEDFKKQYNADTMALLLQGGKCYGLPFSAYATVLYRNLKVLKDAGIDPAAGVKNWADYTAQVEAVAAKGLTGMCKVLGSDWIQKHWYGGVTGAKKDTLSADGKSTTMEADKYATLFEFLLKLKPATAGAFMYDTAATDLFVTNKCAFLTMGPWLSPTLEEAAKNSGLEWDAVQIPGQGDSDHGSVKGGEFTCVMPTKNVEAAWKWASYCCDFNQEKRFAVNLGRFMANDKVLADPEVQKNWLVILTGKSFQEAMLEGPLMKKVAAGWSQPEIDYGNAVDQGTMTPQEAAEKLITEMNKILSGG